MSLAYSAAPFNDVGDSYINATPTPVAAKRLTHSHNKTQKRCNNDSMLPINKAKVKSVLDSIYQNNSSYDNADNNMLGDFNPPPKPQSIGAVKTEGTTAECDGGIECLTNLSSTMPNNSDMPQPNQNNDIELQSLNNSFMNEEQVQQYFKRLGKNPNLTNVSNTGSQQGGSQQLLIDKLNYMINLLEEKQDERTNNVTEEVVLYSFLGIFIIFIVDSFARVGKYVR